MRVRRSGGRVRKDGMAVVGLGFGLDGWGCVAGVLNGDERCAELYGIEGW